MLIESGIIIMTPFFILIYNKTPIIICWKPYNPYAIMCYLNKLQN
jgi:hypothetical protein